MKLPMLCAALLLAACGSHEPPPSGPDPATAIKREAAPAAAVRPLELVAIVSSRVSRVISAESDGAVMKLYVDRDQYVHAGDLVAQLSVEELRSKLAQAQAQKAHARGEAGRAYALASQARRKARLEQRLVRTGASSPEALHAAQSEYSAAGADGSAAAGSIHEAEATIAEVNRLIASANIKSPIDGVVQIVKVKLGEVAHKGATIARVFDPTDLLVKFALPRDKRDRVRIGQRVDLIYGDDQHVAVTVTDIVDDHDPAIDFLQVIAELDRTTKPADIHVGVSGHVRLADKGVAR
jgi:HlyD family secretion protein